jgi:methyl-accepting chemotaxis protein
VRLENPSREERQPRRRRTIGGIELAVWIALAVSIVAVFGAAALLVQRVLRTWRDVRRTGRVLAAGISEIAARTAATAAGVARLAEQPLQAARAVEQLESSVGELAVLRAELRRIRATLASFPGGTR